MAVHIEINSNDGIHEKNKSISINQQGQKTAYALEAMKMLEKIKIVKTSKNFQRHERITFISDNQKLMQNL